MNSTKSRKNSKGHQIDNVTDQRQSKTDIKNRVLGQNIRVRMRLDCPVWESFRVQQIAGMFDVSANERSTEIIETEIPDLSSPWRVGMIVGPSGSGKSQIATRMFGSHLWQSPPWPNDRAVVDCLGDLPAREVTRLLGTVGFSSPPGWIKPYRVLSTGEKFRCDLARAMASAMYRNSCDENSNNIPLVVYDEFTSVVDRTVAHIVAASVSKAVRGDKTSCRFVAVTCHYDVEAWLEPDWTIDMATGQAHWRSLRRPKIKLRLIRCRHAAWRYFAKYHYLSGSLSPTARCFMAIWEDTPVAFCATLPIIGHRGQWRITRLVTRPEFQGLGIGLRVAEAVGDIHHREGHNFRIVAAHPGVISHCQHSPNWKLARITRGSFGRTGKRVRGYRSSFGRTMASYVYIGHRIYE